MARMIPPLIPPDCAPGERLIFERLASDPDAEGWTVLHSLDIAKHVRQVQGEADFIVIVPERGVAVIEVKSHPRVTRRDDGQWVLGKRRPTARSPFQQASEAMHSIRKYLLQSSLGINNVPFLSAVWFTHVNARASLPPTPEWHPWQLLDREDITSGTAKGVLRLLAEGAEHLYRRTRSPSQSGTGPSGLQVKAIVAALRPRFELAAGSAELRHHRESQLSAFLDEQYDALDSMQEHRSVLFTGPAGCGKTFLALESARREAAKGASGWIVCFNRSLGRHLRDRSVAPGLDATSLHRLMLRVTGLTVPDGAGEGFWSETLVDAALDRLLERGDARDYIIVEEAQDLATASYLDVLDLLVRGGLAGGRCLLFGDFERQALYGQQDGREELAKRIPRLVRYNLTSNCRNLPRIGHAAEVITAMQPGYRRFRRGDDGTMPRYLWYVRPREQATLLAHAIQELRDDGFGLEDIVILSPRRAGSAITRCEDPSLKHHLVETDGTEPSVGQLRHSTIYGFKGLEAPAVILTDIDNPQAPDFEALLYVGLTRATDRLTVLATKAALSGKIVRSEG